MHGISKATERKVGERREEREEMELKEKEGTEGVQTCNPTHLPLI
jgi:hypothetical protein